MKDLTIEIRKITSQYGKEFIANDDFLNELKSKFPKKDEELNHKLFVYTVLRDEKVLSQLLNIEKKDIPEYIEGKIAYLSEKYGIDEWLVSTVFKELLVGSGIAEERKGVEDNNNGEMAVPKNLQRLPNRLSEPKKEKVAKGSVRCIKSILLAVLCLFFLPLIPASIKDEFDLPGIIPSLIHYIVSIMPLLFFLTSKKQSLTNISVAGGILSSVCILAGWFFSFGLFSYDYYPYLFEYYRDMSHGVNNVGQLISHNFSVIIVSMVISSMVGLLMSYIFLLVKEQKLSDIVVIFRQSKWAFLLSLAVSTIFLVAVSYLVLKYGIIVLIVDIVGEFIANAYKWMMIALVVLILLLILR